MIDTSTAGSPGARLRRWARKLEHRHPRLQLLCDRMEGNPQAGHPVAELPITELQRQELVRRAFENLDLDERAA